MEIWLFGFPQNTAKVDTMHIKQIEKHRVSSHLLSFTIISDKRWINEIQLTITKCNLNMTDQYTLTYLDKIIINLGAF